MSRIIRNGVLGDRTDDLQAALGALAEDDTVVWIGLTPEELPVVSEPLGLHPHAVEDAMRTHTDVEFGQRTKIDRYPGQVFLYLYLTRLDDAGELSLQDVAVFVSPKFVVVVRATDTYDQNDLSSRWMDHPELAKRGSTGLLYSLLDLVVDSHLNTVDSLGDRVDDMEDWLFDGAAAADDDPQVLQRRAYNTRKSLVKLRRVAQPMRELVGGIMRSEEGDPTPVDAVLMPYYQDVYDHVLRVNDSIEGLRDLLTTIYETRLAMADHTLNTVMKKLTGWAAIIAVVTAVTGFYGQNVPYPGFMRPVGYWTSTLAWLGLSVVLFVFLRRRRWI